MRLKQFLCAGLAAALVMVSPTALSSSGEEVPSPTDLAAGETTTLEESSVPLADEPQTINVILPTAAHIILNPYGLPVETAEGTSRSQIIGQTLTIANEGNTPVIVSASVVGCVSERSGAMYVPVPPAPDTAEKEIFLYAEFQNGDNQWTGDYRGGDNQVLISAAASEAKEVLTLDAESQGVFRLFGATTVSPEAPWCSDDEILVTITFSFTTITEASETPASEEDASAPEETPETPETPKTPTDPETPTEPETPEEPEPPVDPETPGEPEPSTDPDPGMPTDPEPPEVPETPEEPATPTDPELPTNPQTPVAPETPEEPGVPGEAGIPEIEVPEGPVSPLTPAPEDDP